MIEKGSFDSTCLSSCACGDLDDFFFFFVGFFFGFFVCCWLVPLSPSATLAYPLQEDLCRQLGLAYSQNKRHFQTAGASCVLRLWLKKKSGDLDDFGRLRCIVASAIWCFV